MLNKSSHLIFFSISIIGIMITVSASSWFFGWFGMEINMMGVIPLMLSFQNKLSSEASMKYFIIQSISSSIFLLICMMPNFLILMNLQMKSTLLFLTLWIKIGAAPFHFWVPSTSMGLSWMMCLMLFTLQKINPLILINLTNPNLMILYSMIIFTSIMGALGGFNQNSMKKLLAFSSISHIGWIIMASLISSKFWIMYFLIYSISMLPLILLMNEYMINNITQSFMVKKFLLFIIMMNFLSLGGLPPFLGFYPKLLVMNYLLSNYMMFLALPLLLSTLINLYFYLRLSYPLLLNNSSSNSFLSKLYKLYSLISLTPIYPTLFLPLIL